MIIKTLEIPDAKKIRADVIASHMRDAGIAECVCFSCGNASAALKKVVNTLDISPHGDLAPTRWWTPEEIKLVWPSRLDATSGHLPVYLMARIAAVFEVSLQLQHGVAYEVPTGSGETLICLRMAFPAITFYPITRGTPATRWDDRSPLYPLFGPRR